jgi:hypothetical protein
MHLRLVDLPALLIAVAASFVPIGDVEVVEVAPGGAHDENSTQYRWILSEV